MNTANIKLYQILKNDFHLSDEKAREFAQAINDVASENTSISEFKSNIKEDGRISNFRRLVETPTGGSLPWAVSPPPTWSPAIQKQYKRRFIEIRNECEN